MSRKGGEHVQFPTDEVLKAPLERTWTAVLFVLIVCIAPLMFGYTIGYTSPVNDQIQNATLSTDTEMSFFTASMNIGAMVGAIASGKMADALGRRTTLMIGMIPFVGGYLLLSFATNFVMLLVGRIGTGIGVGIVSVATPVYISEVAPVRLRGALGTGNQLSICLGIVIAYVLGMFIDFRWLARIGAIIAGGLFVLLFTVPRTPRWLLQAGKEDAARDSLRRLKGAGADIERELDAIQQSIDSNPSGSVKELVKPALLKALGIGITLMILQQFCGINAVFFNAAKIFESAGTDNPNISALALGSTQLGVTCIAAFLMDRAGRRFLLIFAASGVAIFSAILGGYFWMQSHGHAGQNSWLALTCLVLYIFSFGMGLGAVPWLLLGELFPARVRGQAASICTLVNWTSSFIVTMTFDSMKVVFTDAGVFWFYSGIVVLGILFVLKAVPETKGRSMEELEMLFEDKPFKQSAYGTI
eukprot:TRINITY_DN5431_c0_g1_i1.p1 TRINITY_DN5431_c0_g1~~TRINITY_DN5431_c0_g1_i1.p1  ORF type:complete len:472 (-),score=128.66 TRINITY_DN5431_c0_g1_i1:12-1427(-)